MTKTKTGLKVFTTILDKVYNVGNSGSEGFKKDMKIIFDDFLPRWNYTAVPTQ